MNKQLQGHMGKEDGVRRIISALVNDVVAESCGYFKDEHGALLDLEADVVKQLDTLYSKEADERSCNCHIIRDSAVRRVEEQQKIIIELEAKLKTVDERFREAVGEDERYDIPNSSIKGLGMRNLLRAEIRKRWNVPKK